MYSSIPAKFVLPSHIRASYFLIVETRYILAEAIIANLANGFVREHRDKPTYPNNS
jgi:hypothetical protein